MKRILWIAILMLVGVAVPFALFGGEPEAGPTEPAAAEDAVADETQDEPVAEPAADDEKIVAALPTVFQHDVENYSVAVTVDAAGALELTVVPKTGFHVNTLYPWKYKAADKTFAKDEFQLTEERALLSLVAGQDGELRFSVCNDQTCLIEKVAVSTAETK